MKQAEGISLRRYNTFGIDVRSNRVIQVDSLTDLPQIGFQPGRDLVLGGGSNVLLTADFPGMVLLNRLSGMRIVGEHNGTTLVEAAAGEIWHSLVLWSLANGLSGLENLSLIPGLTGAAPMQNIGAYGVELSDLLESVQAWDWQAERLVEFGQADCDFSYRDSRFKSRDAGRYLITHVRLRLSRVFRPRLGYAGLNEQLAAMELTDPSARQVSQAVIMLRKRKLPDPARIGNAGSFFKNPTVTAEQAEVLARRHEGLPVHSVSAQMAKLSAGWMIEQCGWKGYRDGDAGVSDRHALVLVNHGQVSGAEILDLANRITASVLETFGVQLQPEPTIVRG
jgi:UDP-N-acetylmuramate dehydrogenase